MSSRWREWRARRRALRQQHSAFSGMPPTGSGAQDLDEDACEDEQSFTFVGAAPVDTCDIESTNSSDSEELTGSTWSRDEVPSGSDEEDVGIDRRNLGRSWDAALLDDEIRVIDIHPATSDDDLLVCSFRFIQLPERTKEDEGPRPWLRQPPSREPYYTLSYAWGETFSNGSHLTHTIVRDGQYMRVTANLHSVLKQIRRLQRQGRLQYQGSLKVNLPIWIDAICINQDDVEERSHQVRQMDRIYQSSEVLLIWLGEVNDEDEKIFLGRLVNVCSAYSSDELHPDDWERNRILGRETRFPEDDRRAMLKILTRPWFKRRWVIQEAYYKSSDRRRICLGDFMFQGRHFERALFEMRLYHRAPALERAQQHQRSILYNLQIYHTAKCSDPRDYVYALVSVSPERRTLAIDYSLSTYEMYFSFATEHAGVALLISATTRSARRTDNLAGLPSWIPDWRQPVRYRSIFHEHTVNAFLQDDDSPYDSPVRLHPFNPKLLLVEGRLLTSCPHAKTCQNFRCNCIACRFSRAALRSADGVPVVAGLTADAESRAACRLLLLIDDCSIAFWLERQKSLAEGGDESTTPPPTYRLTTCVALPQYANHRAFPTLLADVPTETLIIC
nr:heterokaryon incompatibility protein 6, or allele [Quercus suber]